MDNLTVSTLFKKSDADNGDAEDTGAGQEPDLSMFEGDAANQSGVSRLVKDGGSE